MESHMLQKLLSSLETWGGAEPEMRETLLPGLESVEARQALAEVILEQFRRWQVHGLNQAELLGSRNMQGILQDKILPQDPEMLERVGHLLGIARALQALYPFAPTARDHWVWRVNEKLANKTPLEVMLAEGTSGIRRVRALLEKEVKAGGMP